MVEEVVGTGNGFYFLARLSDYLTYLISNPLVNMGKNSNVQKCCSHVLFAPGHL